MTCNSCTTAVAREQLCGHVSPATREHAAMGEAFSVRSVPGCQVIVAVVRSEKMVAEAGDNSATQRKGNICHWKPLPSNG
jgi:hypothetical protein